MISALSLSAGFIIGFAVAALLAASGGDGDVR